MLYHVCHSLGRFPFELPPGLPDEQLQLMWAYLELRHEEQTATQQQRAVTAARSGEAQLQAAEAAARARA